MISIHTPHAGSDDICPRLGLERIADFNPHSPCGERPILPYIDAWAGQFQSTLPMRGATTATAQDLGAMPISIHTPHAGSDSSSCGLRPTCSYFNPHSPCGERPTPDADTAIRQQFQSTLPMRGATRSSMTRLWRMAYFNPHSPCGERQQI